MAYALVGSVGAVQQGTSGGAVTGVYGQTPTAGNLLVACWNVQGVSTSPGTSPAGWLNPGGRSGESLTQVRTWYHVATGGDAAPVFVAITSGIQTVMLMEFSGNALATPIDQTYSSASGLTSPQTGTASTQDTQPGELIVYSASMLYSAPATPTASITLNNGATANDTNNNATSTVNHYVFGYGITTSNAGVDTAALAYTTTNATGVAVTASSFQLPNIPMFSVSDPARTRIPGIH